MNLLKKYIVTIAITLLTANVQADYMPQYLPYQKYNSSKSHYLVSVPESKMSSSGFTAVFDVKTKQIAFRTDRYFHDGYVFLSTNGERLLQIYRHSDEKNEYCSLNTFTEKGEEKSIELFTKPLIGQGRSWRSNIFDLYLEDNLLIVEARDSVYSISTETLGISVNLNLSEIDNAVSFREFEHQLIRNDSLFSISYLAINNISLEEKLVKDLDFHYELIQEFSVEFIINHEGRAENIQVNFRIPSSYPEDYYKKENELEEKIIQLLGSYRFARGSIPRGVEFWSFNGVIVLS